MDDRTSPLRVVTARVGHSICTGRGGELSSSSDTDLAGWRLLVDQSPGFFRASSNASNCDVLVGNCDVLTFQTGGPVSLCEKQ